jgi:hypothetical protein
MLTRVAEGEEIIVATRSSRREEEQQQQQASRRSRSKSVERTQVSPGSMELCTVMTDPGSGSGSHFFTFFP